MSSLDNVRYLVVAAHGDDTARRFAASWRGVAMLTPTDLGEPGWVYEDGAAASGSLGKKTFDASTLRGVIVRLPAVLPADVPWIQAEDCVYAAEEMTAFLRAWLGALTCPVLNPVTSGALCGEADSITVARAAARIDMRDIVAWRDSHHMRAPQSVDVVRGVAAVAAVSPVSLAAQMVATSIGLPLLRVRFDLDTPGQEIRVDPWIALDNRQVARLVMAALGDAPAQHPCPDL